MTQPTIGLLGNPNCGKTCLFNALTGSNQQVGNWPGVTVERKYGKYRENDREIAVVDLPGVYCLDAEEDESGLDERVARDYLSCGEADVIVNIVDASNLERNLYLTTQLVEMRLPIVVALNMMDVARDRGVKIYPDLLAEKLGCPVIPIVAAKGEGIESLRSAIGEQLQTPTMPHAYVPYPPVLEEALLDLETAICDQQRAVQVSPRWTALKLLEYDDRSNVELSDRDFDRLVVTNRRKIHQTLGEDLDIIIADSRYSFIHQIAKSATDRSGEASSTLTENIDRVVLNRWLGIPIFLGVMYLMFLFTINISSAFIDFFDILAGTIFVDGLSHLLGNLGTPEWLVVLLAEGAGGGIQTVATFIPVIGFLFLFLSFLEDSGYMARAAFVMDRFMRFIGLPGKSFVPMLVGFGCNVPGIMSTRTLENKRDRLITIVMNPFMSCGARLPVYALFAAAFFPIAGQNIVFGLYLIGITAAICTGLILKNTLLRGEASTFVMELPPYHLPTVKAVLFRTWDRLKAFIMKAGKVIVLMVVVLGLLNSVSVDGSFGHQDSDRSILSATSRSVTPVLAPMGIEQDNWPATVGIFTGVFAKEALVGTLDSLYSEMARERMDAATEDGSGEAFDFWGNVGAAFATIPANLAEVPGALLDPLGLNVGEVQEIDIAAAEQNVSLGTFGEMNRRFGSQASAFAYLLFVLLYAPCVSAIAAVYRETTARWTVFVVAWTTGLAYWVAVMYYQVATLPAHPVSSLLWIGGLLLVLGATFIGLKMARPVPQAKRQQAISSS
ncbi:Fe(2+) transporter permease subunit FeoB [Phormidium sp. CCY1219]|uniref:Fe(2+) transporter permease subunit FeoB n=1 Tax=Phormidium sp. CCY1219 TaxID=2886104 RepID=UPI002D1E612D|nr:Fe(2+) transporter permease subunit FeoB [Phormidium sp. CCY1219]MEB3829192.1 Fe(2+) transporter permease subunit FeoB [Phormidium sp. CCY1219]